MLYPQNGDRIVTIDSVTSLQPMYCAGKDTFQLLASVQCALLIPMLLTFISVNTSSKKRN